jgi:hypothetical protein
MDRSERYVKIGLTLFGTALIRYILPKTHYRLLKAGVLAHLLNFLLNGQLWALLKNFDAIQTSQSTFDRWVEYLTTVGHQYDSIAVIAIYGSQVRDERDSTSDLDVRVIRYPGLLNGLFASLIVAGVRARATVTVFPLDIYVLDGTDSLNRLRDDEPPQVLVDKEGWLDR